MSRSFLLLVIFGGLSIFVGVWFTASNLADPPALADRRLGLGLFFLGLAVLLPALSSLLLGWSRDFTRRKQTAAMLTDQNAQLETVLESVAEPVFVTDANEKIVRANSAYRERFSLEATIEDYLAGTQITTLDGESVQPDQWPVRRVLRGETLRNVELNIQQAGREPMIVSYSGNPILDAHGRVRRAVLTLQDVTQSRRQQEELAQSEERLKAVVRNLAEGLIVVDPTTKTLDWNPAALTLYGYDSISDDIAHLGRLPDLYELWTTDATELPFEQWPINRLLRGERIRDLELVVRHKKWGWRRTFSYTGTLVRNNRGEPSMGLLTMRDVSERKNLEEELRQRVEELETVMDAAPVAIFIAHDPKCLKITGNRMANEIYEAEPRENVSATTIRAIRGFSRRGVELTAEDLPMQQAAASNKDIRGAELDVRLPSGKMITILGHAGPLRDAEGRVRGAVGTFLDITELKRASLELEHAARIVKLAHRAANAGAWEWNIRNNELTWTEEYYRLLKIDPTVQPTQEIFYSLVHSDDRDKVRAETEASVAACRDFQYDFRIVLPDGVHWIERRGMVISGDDGAATRMVGISSDVTARKRLEEALRRSNEDLQRFAYISSHDLREPLRNVSAMTSLLLRVNKGRLVPESEHFEKFIVEGVERMNRLIESLLQYSSVANDDERPFLVEMDKVLSTALDDLRTSIQESGAAIVASPLPVLNGNASLLVRVFQNLISNAIKYRSPSQAPQITISVEERGEEWLFVIEDNGIGFDQKYAEHIFVPFKRLHGHTDYQGTGIGLAIVKRVVNRHGGDVCAESKPGVGSKFYFTLPRHGIV